MRRMRSLRRLMVFLAVATAVPAFGQQSDFKAVLGGSQFPLLLHLKDLNGDWRRMSVGGQADAGVLLGMFGAMMDAAMGAAGGAYYTKGDSVKIGEETYLVAYRVQTNATNIATLMRSDTPPRPPKLTPETPLSLCLLNLRGIGSLTDIREFNMDQELAESARVQGEETQVSTVSNLKQVAMSLLMYTEDYDEVLPPMKNPETAQVALIPYVKSESLFLQPDTHQPLQPNPLLSYRPVAAFEAPADTPIFYEATPLDRGGSRTRAVAYLDGHVTRVPETDWQIADQQIRQGIQACASSLDNLARLDAALLKYAGAHRGALPSMKDAAALKKALAPAATGDAAAIFVHPYTHEPYAPNPLLSGKRIATLKEPAETITLFEANIAYDGTRGVAFLDGHAKRFTEAQWEQLRLKAKIP